MQHDIDRFDVVVAGPFKPEAFVECKDLRTIADRKDMQRAVKAVNVERNVGGGHSA